MKRIFLILILSLSYLFALDIPVESKDDSRITYAVYNVNNVVRINAQVGYTSVVEFLKDENVINMALGFSEGWDLTSKGNLLFITAKAIESKNVSDGNGGSVVIHPRSSYWKTNLIVNTNRNMYVFELQLSEKNQIYKLSFLHPEKDAEKLKFISAQLKKETENKIVETALNRTSVPRNWEFYAKKVEGSEDIMPNYVYDDGLFIFLGFDNTKTFPSVFGLDNSGNEEVLNTHIKKVGNYDILVVQKIIPKLVLRSGDKVIGILNKGYAKNPLEKTQQTSNDNFVERRLKNGK